MGKDSGKKWVCPSKEKSYIFLRKCENVGGGEGD